jgi:hypothetical protein
MLICICIPCPFIIYHMRNTILRYHYVAMREKYSQDYHLLYYYKSTLKNIKKKSVGDSRQTGNCYVYPTPLVHIDPLIHLPIIENLKVFDIVIMHDFFILLLPP